MDMDSDRPAEPGLHAPHCVVWHAPGVEPPADLMAPLRKRHMSIEFRTGPFAAFAELCAIDRASRADASSDHAGHRVALVLVQPSALEEPAAVVRAMELYLPRAICWRYEPSAKVQLKSVTSAALEPAASPKPRVEVVIPPAHQRAAPPGAVRHPGPARPPLRLAGEGVLPPRPEEAEPLAVAQVREDPAAAPPRDAPAAPHAQLLSREELAMLFGEDTLDQSDQPVPPPRRTGDAP